MLKLAAIKHVSQMRRFCADLNGIFQLTHEQFFAIFGENNGTLFRTVYHASLRQELQASLDASSVPFTFRELTVNIGTG